MSIELPHSVCVCVMTVSLGLEVVITTGIFPLSKSATCLTVIQHRESLSENFKLLTDSELFAPPAMPLTFKKMYSK